MNKPQYKHLSSLTLLVLLILLLPVRPSYAQDTIVVQDLHLWSGVKIEKTFAKDWTISLAEELRFKHDITEINNHFTEAGLRYRINKNFALEGQYRLTFDKNKDDSYDLHTRYALDLRYKGRLDFISIFYRLRYQKEVEGWNVLDPNVLYEKYVRNRVRFRYEDLGRFKPYVSAEIFQLFEPYQAARYEYIRILAGVKYNMPRAGSFNLAYGLNLELAKTQPLKIYTIKINYTYSF